MSHRQWVAYQGHRHLSTAITHLYHPHQTYVESKTSHWVSSFFLRISNLEQTMENVWSGKWQKDIIIFYSETKSPTSTLVQWENFQASHLRQLIHIHPHYPKITYFGGHWLPWTEVYSRGFSFLSGHYYHWDRIQWVCSQFPINAWWKREGIIVKDWMSEWPFNLYFKENKTKQSKIKTEQSRAE